MKDNEIQRQVRENVIAIVNQKNKGITIEEQQEINNLLWFDRLTSLAFIYIPLTIFLLGVSLQIFWNLLH